MAFPLTLPALATDKTDATTTATDHAAHHNALATEVNGMGGSLGLSPQGLYAATVRERFEIAAYKGQSCRCATTANLAATYANGTAGVGATLTANPAAAMPTIDGQTMVVGDRVLVKNQTTPAQNGIYTVTQITSPWILTRSIDADMALKIADMKVLVDSGNLVGDTEWYCATTNPTVGTTPIYFRRTTPFYGHGNPRNPWDPGSLVNQVIFANMPRQNAVSAFTMATAATQYMVGGLVAPAGRVVTNINCIFTTANAPTIRHFSLARQSDRIVMAHTTNTTTAPTANAIYSQAFVTPWTPIEDTPVWVVLSHASGTANGILSAPAVSNAAINLLAPAMQATNGVTPTTTVATDGTTVITAATTGGTQQMFFWLT